MKAKTIIHISIKIMVLVWVILVINIYALLRETFTDSFNFSAISWTQLIVFTLIGALIALSNLDLTKTRFGYNHNVVNIVFVIIILIISLTFNIESLIFHKMMRALGLFSGSATMVFQVLFGYSFMQLFIKK